MLLKITYLELPSIVTSTVSIFERPS